MFNHVEYILRVEKTHHAEVSELADEQDSGSCERLARVGSSPIFRTKNLKTCVCGNAGIGRQARLRI